MGVVARRSSNVAGGPIVTVAATCLAVLRMEALAGAAGRASLGPQGTVVASRVEALRSTPLPRPAPRMRTRSSATFAAAMVEAGTSLSNDVEATTLPRGVGPTNVASVSLATSR